MSCSVGPQCYYYLMRKEVVLGTSDEAESAVVLNDHIALPASSRHNNSNDADDDDTPSAQPPAIADVAAHLSQLRALLLSALPSPSPSSPSPSPPLTSSTDAEARALTYAHVCIHAHELSRIAEVDDALDQVLFWAMEEAGSYAEEPSQLSEVEAPEAVYACAVLSKRPRLMVKALSVFVCLLQHPQSAAELLRVAALYAKESGAAAHDTHFGRHCQRGRPLVDFLADVLLSHPGHHPLQTQAIATATALLPYVGWHGLLHQRTLLQAVASVLHQRYASADADAIVTEAVNFFATVVDLPVTEGHASDSSEEEEEEDADGVRDALGRVSAATLLVQNDEICTAMVGAVRVHWSHLRVKQRGLHFLCECARCPENRVVLLQSAAYTVMAKALTELLYSPELFHEAAEAVSSVAPLLDSFQRRSLVLLVRRVLLEQGDMGVLLVALALLHTLLITTAPAGNSGAIVAPSTSGGQAYAMYAMCPQPPTHSQTAGAECAAAATMARLQQSALFPHPSSHEWLSFLHDQRLPQIVGHVVDYHTYAMARASRPEEDDNEVRRMKALCGLATRCIALMTAPHSLPHLSRQ